MDGGKQAEKSGNPATYPAGGGFAALLDWHLKNGTRPDGRPDRPGKSWGNKEFAPAVGVNERTVRNWREGRSPPRDIASIERALFGDNALYDAWRGDLRMALDAKPAPEVAPVPRPSQYFLGREADMAILVAALREAAGAAILVQGGPGIGKTTLTEAVALNPDVTARFGEERRCFVALETATTTAAMQDAVMRAVGADVSRGFGAALARLADWQGLLILDNLETPWEPTAERRGTEETLADIASVPGLAVLASFRGRDRVGGPAWSLVHLVVHLGRPVAEDLFCRIAGQEFAGDPFLQKFTTALGGVPLAIELVARRAYGLGSLGPLWREWERIGADLAAHPDFEHGRLTSLPHSIELSLTSVRMNEGALRLFRLLGQLPAGLVAEDRDALLDGGFVAEEALRRTGLAVEREGRLDLLPPVRDHAARHHRPNEPDQMAWAERFLDLTQRLGEAIPTAAGEGAVARMTPEFSNIEAAFRAVLAAGCRERAMAALCGFGAFTSIAALPTLVLGELAVACHTEDDVLGKANCIFSLGDIALRRSEHDAARKAYEQALPLYKAVGSVQGAANCIRSLGDIALRRSDNDTARETYEQAILLHRKIGDVQGEANCIRSLGDIALRRFDHDTARETYEHAILLYRKTGDLQGEANCIFSLGDIAMARSDLDAARDACEQALPLYQKVGDALGEANCIRSFGDIALACSDPNAAREAYAQAMLLYQKVGAKLGEANCIRGFGDIAFTRSDHNAAREAYEKALPLYRRIGEVTGEAHCRERLELLKSQPS